MITVNASISWQNDRRLADDIFKCIFMNENVLCFDSNFTEILEF